MKTSKTQPKNGKKSTRIFRRHSAGGTITITKGSSGMPENVRLNDIGMGGLSFKSDRKLRLGAVIFVRAGSGEQTHQVKAQVAWVKEDDGSYAIGLSFSDPKYASRVRIMSSLLSK